MPGWLASVRDRFASRLNATANCSTWQPKPATTQAPRRVPQIGDEVRVGADVWTRLERHLQEAIPVFLEAQNTQRFRPRGLAAAIDMSRDVFDPAITAATTRSSIAGSGLVTGIAAPPTPVCWGTGGDDGSAVQGARHLRSAPTRGRRSRRAGEPPGDSIPDDVARCAAEVLAVAAEHPTRLSELLARSRAAAPTRWTTRRGCSTFCGAPPCGCSSQATTGPTDERHHQCRLGGRRGRADRGR